MPDSYGLFISNNVQNHNPIVHLCIYCSFYGYFPVSLSFVALLSALLKNSIEFTNFAFLHLQYFIRVIYIISPRPVSNLEENKSNGSPQFVRRIVAQKNLELILPRSFFVLMSDFYITLDNIEFHGVRKTLSFENLKVFPVFYSILFFQIHISKSFAMYVSRVIYLQRTFICNTRCFFRPKQKVTCFENDIDPLN